MGRFDYLDRPKGKAAKGGKGGKKKAAQVPASRRGETAERVETVYVRRETIRAVWREYRRDGGESVSELVEDLLLKWLRERA